VAGALLVGAVGVLPAAATTTSTAAPRGRPNILFVLTDDMAYGDLDSMPHVHELVADDGASFTNYFANVSLCCPSRVTMLRGQYAHNTGVQTNGDAGANGGFAAALRLGLEQDTVATRLQAAGYRTGLFGKYLNHYPGDAGRAYVPPGWSRWASPVDGTPYGQYDYVLNENGTNRAYGRDLESYGTTVYTGFTEALIRDSARDGQPFFAYVSLYAPHEPATPAPEDIGRFAGATAPRTDSFDLDNAASMPAYVRELPRLALADVASIDALYERRLESLQAVDRAVARLVAVLGKVGALRNTFIVFASDNGYHLGQHRLPAGKQTPYDTDTHVPFLVRGPGIAPGTTVGSLSSTVDLMPTFLAMAGVDVAQDVDGRSLLDAARGPNRNRVQAPRAVLLEHWNDRPLPTPVAVRPAPIQTPLDVAGPSEPTDLDQRGGPVGATLAVDALDPPGIVPEFSGLRTARWLYVEYGTGEHELYDVRADPDQIRNLAGSDARTERGLAERLATLRGCRGLACRRADGGRRRGG
jgi:arylsulfatase A-like enzyme